MRGVRQLRDTGPAALTKHETGQEEEEEETKVNHSAAALRAKIKLGKADHTASDNQFQSRTLPAGVSGNASPEAGRYTSARALREAREEHLVAPPPSVQCANQNSATQDQKAPCRTRGTPGND